MVIECPYCTTRFRLDERSIAGRTPSLRCSKCHRTFPLPPHLAPKKDPDELSFSYEDEAEWDADGADEDASQESQEQFSFPIGRHPRDDAPGETQRSLFADEAASVADEEGGEEGGDDIEDDEVWIDETDGVDEDDEYEIDPQHAGEEEWTRSTQIRPVLLFLMLVVAGYGLFAWTLHTDPGWARRTVQQLPLIRDQVEANRLRDDIELVDLDGRYERTKEGKLIFLITGRALNQHDEPLHAIRVTLQLLDAAGDRVAQQSTTCGNPLRVELIRDLTIQQVAILRGWGSKPPKEATVQPGASCPLISIFIDIPETITDFTARVVQARQIS